MNQNSTVLSMSLNCDDKDINGTGNFSFSSMDFITKNSVIKPSVSFACGVIGNLLALIVLYKSSKDQRRTIFYRLVAGLTITDLMGTILTSPVVITVYTTKRWVGGDIMCSYFGYMMLLAGFSTMTIVCSMSIERIVCIRHPYVYYTRLTKKHATLILICCWFFSAFIAFLPILGFGKIVRKYPCTWCYVDYYSKEAIHIAYNYFLSILAIGIIIVTFCCNITVIYTILNSRRKRGILERSDGLSRRTQGPSKRYAECQMLILLIGITIVFSSCYAPLYVRIIMNQTGRVSKNMRLDLLLIQIASYNQVCDPWVYILLRREFLWKIISGVKCLLRIGHDSLDEDAYPRRPAFDVENANCCLFCFHCLCDPPIQRQRSNSMYSEGSNFINTEGRRNTNININTSMSNLKSTSMGSLNGKQILSTSNRVSSANDIQKLLINNTLKKHGICKSNETRFIDDVDNV